MYSKLCKGERTVNINMTKKETEGRFGDVSGSYLNLESTLFTIFFASLIPSAEAARK